MVAWRIGLSRLRVAVTTITGTWSAEGKTLIISLEGENEISFPFTFHEGQLVYPNIPSQRGFWEKIE